MIIIGLLCTILGGLGSAYMWTSASQTQSTLVSMRDITRGETVTATDLAILNIGSTEGINVIPADQLQTLIGKTALHDLPRGTILIEGTIGEHPIPIGMSRVGLRIATGKFTGADLRPGTNVTLVQVSGLNSGSGDTAQALAEFPATVNTKPEKLSDGNSWSFNVLVNQPDSSTIAALAASDQLVVVEQR
jgi:hypothetical protein